MSPTRFVEDDLRRALTSRSTDVTDAQSIMARVERAAVSAERHSRRPLAMLGIAAAVVAVVAVPLGVRSLRADNPAPTPPAAATLPATGGQALRYTTSMRLLPGYTLTSVTVTPRVQSLTLHYRHSGAGRQLGLVFIATFAPGQFHPAQLMTTATRTTAAGHVAYFRPSSPNAKQESSPHTLAWSIGGDRWITILNSPPSGSARSTPATQLRADQLIAAALDTTTSHDLALPIRIKHLPRGLNRYGGSEQDPVGTPSSQPATWTAEVDFGQPTRAPHLSVTATSSPANLSKANVRIDGRPGIYRPATKTTDATVQFELAAATITVTGTYSKAELLAVTRSITTALRPSDRSTWFDAMR